MARQFFAVSVCVAGVATGVFWSLMTLFGRAATGSEFVFPPAFLASTILLLLGSVSLHKATRLVKIEKQIPFRRWLLSAICFGTLFIGVQSYALWSMFPPVRTHQDAVLGVTGFIVALSTLHGLHFWVAVMFLSYVTAKTWQDRYDHEYHWGVTVCTWFWHALGVVWLIILGVVAISL